MILSGLDSPNWKGDNAGVSAKLVRSQKTLDIIGVECLMCSNTAEVRHHRDRNQLNNDPRNIWCLCRGCHSRLHRQEDDMSWAKLTFELATEIRERYEAGGVTYIELGREYGVDRTTIGEAVRSKTWAPRSAPSTPLPAKSTRSRTRAPVARQRRSAAQPTDSVKVKG